ncbi:MULTISPECIES: ABC transporter substrate-binding protein [Kosmotoga]|uniref:Extracellular solute-binding protein family 1 n=1 Tax=Kosmotoga olearia (strain ATCC BAA-1733 / DSM 21960 / TBF 19.5.1) TaxID=521045 RepID=C5CE13_KOSOT|nr:MULTISPECIES: ABC transporter substrate-binding protein [Kosmotoga]ACR80115.1 extracellular solute-binding protein family 1 [Kosmotoga olearia TBF 19.5.1]OAA20459.1 glycerol-3-phosphate ABC transporter substrate-binding protein [Kosmotoga sp. DU53]
MRKFFLIVLLVALLATLGLAKVKIQFWHAMGGWRIALLQEMAEEFMAQNPDIEVEVQYTGGYGDTINKLNVAVQSNTAPHVVQGYDIATQMLIDGQIAVPMQDLIDKDPDFDINTFLPQVLNYYKVNGKLYCMPFNSSNPILYYNKTLFKKAGLDPNKPPRTFEELIEYAKKLTIRDEKGNIIQAGITWNLHSWFFEQFMAVQNAPLVDNNNGRTGRPTKAVFNSEAGLRFFKLWYDLTKNGYMINTKVHDWTGARNLFISQKVAMLISSTSDVRLMVDSSKENGFELGTAFLPRPKDAESGGVAIGGGSLWIIAGHPKEEIDAAWRFVKFMAEPEQQIKWHKGTGYFPVRKDAIETLLASGYYSENPHNLTAILQLLLSTQNYNTNGAIIGAFAEVRSIVENYVQKMLNGDMTPEEALAAAEREATKAIREYEGY